MRFYSFTLEKPVMYFMGGEFTASNTWQHHARYHKGDYEIIFCLKGTIFLQVDSEKYAVKSNQMIIIPPFKHLVGYKKSEKNVDFYWLHFFPQCTAASFEADEKDIVNQLKSLNYGTNNMITLPVLFNIDNYKDMTIAFHQLLSMGGKLNRLEKRDFLTSALLIEIFESYVKQQDHSSRHAKIEHLKEWIKSNMSNTLTVNEIAENVHLNRNYLTRIFKRYTGMTTFQYINKIKIELASLLLLRTEMSIKEISYAAYFTTPKMFMRRFKIETDLSPTEYRNKYSTILKNNSHIDPFIPVPSRISDSINDGVNENVAGVKDS
ncbi:MAG: AraC family transcriptional regulator [Sporolactobacillus sp.]|jgi:AraC-like DNA-binding protein|nr:AraC family transcriptional regulator [Sporolactobacillus sp.]